MAEDTNRTRKGESAQNLALIRKLALNLLRKETSVKTGCAAKQKRAGWDRNYLLTILAQTCCDCPEGHPINGHPTAPFSQALGHQLGQESVAMALAGIESPERAGQVPQHGRPRWRTFKLVTGLVDRQPGGGSQDQHPQQVTPCNSPGHLQRHGGERVEGHRVHVRALQGNMRLGRPGDSPVVLRALAYSSRYRRVPDFL